MLEAKTDRFRSSVISIAIFTSPMILRAFIYSSSKLLMCWKCSFVNSMRYMDDIDRYISQRNVLCRANVNKHGDIHVEAIIYVHVRERILYSRRIYYIYIDTSLRYCFEYICDTHERKWDRCIRARLPKIFGSIDLYESELIAKFDSEHVFRIYES